MSSNSKRLGFIGVSATGSWATRSHLPFLQSDRNTTGYTISALQNSSKQAAEASVSTHKIENAATYGSPEELANDPNVDIVAVSVNVPGHYETVMPALKAGKDIFVEWPLARNLKDAEEMTKLAKEKGLRTLVGLQARQNPSVLALKKLYDAGELGEILGTTMHGYGGILGATSPQSYAYMFSVEAGANILTIPFGHAIDALCYVLGEWKYVSATLANRRPNFSVTDDAGKVLGEATKTSHDFITVNGELKSGGIVNAVYESATNPSGGPSFVWQVNGTKGTVLLELESPVGHLQMFQPSIKFAKNGGQLKAVDVKQVGADFSYAVGEAWNAFAGKGDGHVTTFEDALVRHKMIDAIYRSNKSGRRETYL